MLHAHLHSVQRKQSQLVSTAASGMHRWALPLHACPKHNRSPVDDSLYSHCRCGCRSLPDGCFWPADMRTHGRLSYGRAGSLPGMMRWP